MIDGLSTVVNAFFMRMLTLLSVDKILLSKYVNLSTHRSKVKMQEHQSSEILSRKKERKKVGVGRKNLRENMVREIVNKYEVKVKIDMKLKWKDGERNCK